MRFLCVDLIHSRDLEQSADSIMNSNLIPQMLQRPSTGSRCRTCSDESSSISFCPSMVTASAVYYNLPLLKTFEDYVQVFLYALNSKCSDIFEFCIYYLCSGS
ncbi:uncharacterized protein [Spinacia oleracea]|uniref:Uncharacterized protein n=1 Tax=Spinacia oleracea TaxID=3562 RepID=A0ABM3R6L0_SPIOL|nr:uncharacterized protein LOC130466340 [Spinacia oleracea]